MGQSTNLYTTIRFAGKTYNSKRDVTNDLEVIKDRITRVEQEMLLLAFMTQPEKFKSEDESTEGYLNRRVSELLGELEDLHVMRYKLEILEERWDNCHTKEGLGINPPEEVRFKHYIDGDFVYTEKYPNNESFFK